MAFVRNLTSYKRYINRKNYHFQESVELNEFKKKLGNDLLNTNSILSNYLSSLSEENKIQLITALITNNAVVLVKILVNDGPLKNDIEQVRQLVLHNRHQDDTKWLNDSTKQLIHSVLNLRGFNHSTQHIHKAQNIIEQAIKTVPESILSISAKRAIYQASNVAQYGLAEDVVLFYQEHIRPLPKNKSLGYISKVEYQISTKNIVDSAQYIILTLGLLQYFADMHPDLNVQIEQIRDYYDNLEYSDAIDHLNKLCTQYQSLLGNELCNFIHDRQNQISKIAEFKNYSRRFYENRINALFADKVFKEPDNLASVSKICGHYLGEDYVTIKDVSQAMNALATLSHLSNTTLIRRMEELKNMERLWLHRGRGIKIGFTAKSNEATGESSDAIFSRNLGTMTSSQPNYFDELSDNELRNRVPDINTTTVGPYDYANIRPASPFVASLSGHAFFIIAVLEDYMNKFANSPTLENDINNFLMSFLHTFTSYGYHSTFEVLDIFALDNIQKIFQNKKINLYLNWPTDLMEQAFRDTQEYTKNLAIKHATNKKINLHDALLEGHFSLAKKLLASDLIDINHIDHTGHTELDYAIHHNNVKIVQFLLAQGAETNLEKKDTGNTPLFDAIHQSNIDIAALLISHKADLNKANHKGITPLHLAVELENTAWVTLLINHHAKLDSQDKDGNTPLHLAILQEAGDNIQQLIKAGCKTNIINNHKQSPLLAAISTGNPNIIKCLLSAGLRMEDEDKSNIRFSQLQGILHILNKYQIVSFTLLHLINTGLDQPEMITQEYFDNLLNIVKQLDTGFPIFNKNIYAKVQSEISAFLTSDTMKILPKSQP